VTGTEAPASGEDFDVRIAWRRDDPRIEADAIALWTETGILPAEVSPEKRAKEIVVAVYSGDRLAALATAVPEQVGFLRSRMFVLRSMTAPDFRRSHAQVLLTLPVKHTLEAWAAAHPEEQVAGVIGFVQPGAWGDLFRMPVAGPWPLTLIAYTHDGQQVRAAWFDHYRFA
jgi:hypothetical protein